jgi:hypothetical protein
MMASTITSPRNDSYQIGTTDFSYTFLDAVDN